MRRVFLALALLGSLIVTTPARAVTAAASVKFPCKVIGTAKLDPIVVPNGGMSAHEHLFTGNLGVPMGVHDYNVAITQATSCKFAGDTAAYWVPTLRRPDGSLVPAKVTVYYDRMTSQRITAFPKDFGMVWGSVWGVFNSKQRSYYGWNCDNTEPLQPNFSNVNCPGGAVTFRAFSPFCWDGVTPAGRDYGNHVFYPNNYPTNAMCPAGSTVLPRLRVNFNFQTASAKGYTFSSDMMAGVKDGASAHTDFWNTWNQSALEGLVAQLNA